ncbi:flagellar M-ring protein FliF [Alkalihalobacillus alcalophilus ATCC 27647 = CGMCC 1.3604]|uniref:Flagellar M-ring protein n=1 Tax=Alkalihalobacillus alcalophilus ATCC 27647 = CGMCC 1.3604 TaxID=1218173 RepID=A0A094WKK7_ALKAL|nr:flagellar basal-body MS-ring/collar protein FliF [Alkalihalobacillus alcalophilus]KGA98254.1 flagellar M-ring protein FliF [Alkalihalobacillus alcalophilus ATCC 27647 = CGMCC 1.3604]MED1562193.1 flagellar basal-body MS-ring/collar protein FliF [Alkalihalobacillus alcalophilus]THG91418.1 flagellar M-ring protein FliF [Alkalihalobacillus alcalophilus ATCC 27647 = CGMCC 1.3604]
MKEKLLTYKDKITSYWAEKTETHKRFFVIGLIGFIIFISLLVFFTTRTTFVPLYSNLSVQETGQIKATLDSRGVSSKVSDNGTTIMVPEPIVDNLKVELAAEGIPNSGNIDYTSIQDQMGFGMTDNEFKVIERAAIQTELENLISSIDGIQNANVMITLPEDSVWLNTEKQSATAAIILNVAPGYSLDENRVRALYHLVSRSVPNLPIENIGISDQMFNSYFYEDENSSSVLAAFEQQRKIQKDIELDITQSLQQMLGTIVGRDKVLVSVTTDIDFTQENRMEQLVTPVNEETIEGIVVSVERVEEAYSGSGTNVGGIAGTGDEIPNYEGVDGAGESEWERTEERINTEVNRVNREIVESPYQIRDIGIQVMVEPPEGMEQLPIQQINDIEQILATVVRTSLPTVGEEEMSDAMISERIFVSSQPFQGKLVFEEVPNMAVPTWLYVAGTIVLIVIIALILLLLKGRKKEEVVEEEEKLISYDIEELLDEDISEHETKRRQLEKMAKEKPEDFSKLLRTWLSED